MSTENKELEVHSLPGGKALVFNEAQIAILMRIIDREIWWGGTWSRISTVNKWAATMLALIAATSLFWQHIRQLLVSLASTVGG